MTPMPSALLERPQASRKHDDGEFIDCGMRAVFAEHTNRAGVPFGPADMERIAERCNNRIKRRGAFSPIVVRHTKDDGSDDPEVIGLAGPYETGELPDGTRAVFARWRLYKEHADKLKKYPRVSVEYWAEKDNPRDGYFDPISVLGAETPELDLPLLYQQVRRGGRTMIRYQAVMPGGSNTYVPSLTDDKRKRYQESTNISQDAIKQIIQAITPVIEEIVSSKVAAQMPAGHDTMDLLEGGVSPLGEPPGEDDELLEDEDEGGDLLGELGDEGGGLEGEEPEEGDLPPLEGEGDEEEPEPEEGEETSPDSAETPAEEESEGPPAKPKKKKPAAEKFAKNDDDDGDDEDEYEPDLTSSWGSNYEKDERTGKPSEEISAEKAKEVLKDGTVHGKPLTEKQRGMFGAAAGRSHYEKLCKYESDGDTAGAEAYWAGLDDDDRKRVRGVHGEDSDESRRAKMSRYMADSGQCSATKGEHYMAGKETAEQAVVRYEKEVTDYKKKLDDVTKELTEYKTKYQKAVESQREAETNHKALAERVDRIESEKRVAVRYQKLTELASSGYVLDPAEEVKDCESMTDDQFTKHTERIAAKYSRVPIPGVNTFKPPTGESFRMEQDARKTAEKRERYAKIAADKVMQLRAENKPADYKTELNKLLAEDPESKQATQKVA